MRKEAEEPSLCFRQAGVAEAVHLGEDSCHHQGIGHGSVMAGGGNAKVLGHGGQLAVGEVGQVFPG